MSVNAQQVYKEMTNEELMLWYKDTKELSVKQELALRYVYLVKSIALQMRDVYLSFSQVDDIINEGVLTIMSAIDKFDVEMNVKFETYVSKRIKGMIIDLARKQDWVPRSARRSNREIEEATNLLYNQNGVPPTIEDITQYLNITPEKYQDTLHKASLFNILSLDMVLAEAQGNDMASKLPQDEGVDQPETRCLKDEISSVLAEGIKKLKENEQNVISLYYVDELSMRQIAEVLQVSEPRVSQIHTSAIKKLKEYMEKYNEERKR